MSRSEHQHSLELTWQKGFSDPRDFDPERFLFAVSGFRSEALFLNPNSLVNPYYSHLFVCVIGKDPNMDPDTAGHRWRFGTFRPWGAIVTFQPELVLELRDHDPGPPELEDPTPSLNLNTITPLQLLNQTQLHNECKMRLSRTKPTAITGYYCIADQLQSTESLQLQKIAKEQSLPFLVFDQVTGQVKKI